MSKSRISEILILLLGNVKTCFYKDMMACDFRLLPIAKTILLFILFSWLLSAFALGETYHNKTVDTVRFHRLLDIAKIHPLDSALVQLDNAEKLARSLNSNTLVAEALIRRGKLLMKHNRLNAADTNFRKAKAILMLREKNNQYLLLLKNLAICNYYLGNNPKVLGITQEGLKVAQKLDNKMFQGIFNNISGIAMDEMGKRARALKYYLRALDLFESLKDEEKIASVETNIGIIYEEQKNLDATEKYFTKAFHVAIKIKDTSLISSSYNNLANVYSDRKEYKRSLDYFFKSVALSRKINDLYTVAMDLNNIGSTYENLKNDSLALDYYQQALKLARKIHDSHTISLSLSNIAEIYEKKQNIPQAIRYSTESWEVVRHGGDVNNELSFLKQLQHLYAVSDDYKNAYNFILRYVNMRDSVFSKQKAIQLEKVQMDYASKAKDQSLKLAKEKQKIIQAYFIGSLFALLLVIAAAVFLIRLRMVKNKALKRRMQFVDNLLEYSESYLLLLDKNFRISYLSTSYQKDFGYTIDEINGVDPSGFIHPDDAEQVKKEIKDSLRTNQQRVELLFRLRNSAGEYRYMQAIFNDRRENPDLNGYVLNFWDITELRKKQQAISESEKKYYDIFNAFPDIYFRIDMKGIITEISPSVHLIAGFDPDEVVDKSIFDFVEMDMTWEKARKILFGLKHIKDYSITIWTKDRRKIYCSLNVHDVKNHQGEIIGFEGVLRDISGRVATEKQLQQSERELKEANISKDKILSIIGHDLLGPIGTQKSIFDMVIDEVEDFSREEILQLLQTMKPSLDATYTMIENLLSWARIMRRSIKPNLKQNNLSLIVKQSFEQVEQQAEQKKIKLIYSGDKEVLAAFDKNLIEIVLRNLLFNAIKFSHPDSEIRVAAVRKGNNVEVSVSDQGRGLSEEDIRKILKEKEKMESKPGTNKEKGTGLGLIVVKEFIQLNNGELQIKSKPGQGTTFSFMLPLA